MKYATNWADLGFIISSEYRKKILKSLEENPKTPSKISKEVQINKSHVSKTLSELTKKKIIICLNPLANKGKFYQITTQGKEILKQISKLE